MIPPRPLFDGGAVSCELVSPQALSQTVRRALGRVRLARPRDADEDLCQSVAAALLGRHQLGAGIPAAYIQVAARNAVIDGLRRQLRRPLDLGLAPAARPRPCGENPTTRLIDARVRDAVKRQLSALSESRRRAVVAYLQGESVPAIAAAMGCNRKRADNLLYRGLAELRRGLAGEGITPDCYA